MKIIRNSGITKYSVSLIDMGIAFENVLNGEEECIFFVEHEGVYSAGKSFDRSDFIGKKRLPVYYPNRGGRVTIHSKGQLVVYPIINLRKRDINVSCFVKILENWMINALKRIGIESELSKDGIGVWANGAKIGFVGINISEGVSTHGICLNVNNDLSYFSSIIPCGINNVSITSVSDIKKEKFEMEKLVDVFVETSPF